MNDTGTCAVPSPLLTFRGRSDAILCHYTTVVAEVGFKEPEYRLVEGENTTVCVTLEGTLEKSVMVNYTLIDVTASGE